MCSFRINFRHGGEAYIRWSVTHGEVSLKGLTWLPNQPFNGYTRHSILHTMERTQVRAYTRWRHTHGETYVRWSVHTVETYTQREIHTEGTYTRWDIHTVECTHVGEYTRWNVHAAEYIHGVTYTRRGHM